MMWTVEEAKEAEQSTYEELLGKKNKAELIQLCAALDVKVKYYRETLEICQKENVELRHTIKHILEIIKEGH